MIRQRIKDYCYYFSVYGNPFYREWFRSHRQKLEKFRDLHRNERCFILGNGPSLNSMNLNQLQGCQVFGLNKISLIFERFKFDLSYHVAVNPLVIDQSAQAIRALDCPSFVDYQQGYPQFETCQKVNYIYTGGNLSFSPDITVMIHQGFTVTFVALQIAFYMGFGEVYLLGVDHRFAAVGAPNEKQYLLGDDSNHFDPAYFRGQEWQLPDLEGSELAYRLADFHFRRAGRRIFDATLDGELTIFPKMTFNDALARCRNAEK